MKSLKNNASFFYNKIVNLCHQEKIFISVSSNKCIRIESIIDESYVETPFISCHPEVKQLSHEKRKIKYDDMH